jgi:aspartyl/glutamyl-tRNA(asn/gln) amidotransferase, B subunit
MSNYIPTIGTEVHVELKTNTKIFSSSKNGYGSMANSLTNVVDLGYPGTLPTLNREVIMTGIRACHVLHCNIRKLQHFDRKNYFYPDNPKNYQITEARTPIGYDGYVEIEVDGVSKKIEIEEIHIEEDTCKSAHRGSVSLLDFNRAGVPLIEIVTKPCMTSAIEAKLYLEKLRELLFYSDISDCKMEEGSMRCDANVSLRKSVNDPLGTKCEVKNIGSISNVFLAINKEIERQSKLLDEGVSFPEQTRRYDDKLGDTVLMRVKETGNDYRYFPEPDIPYVVIDDEMIEEALKKLPMSAAERTKLYIEKGMDLEHAKKIIANRMLSDYLNEFLDTDLDFKTAGNLLLGDISFYLNKEEKRIEDTTLTSDKFLDLVSKVNDGSLTSKNVKDILELVLTSSLSIEEIIKKVGISNITDTGALEEIVLNVISNNPDSVSDYKAGKDRAIKYLMGQIMKETKGSANPKLVNEILTRELNK